MTHPGWPIKSTARSSPREPPAMALGAPVPSPAKPPVRDFIRFPQQSSSSRRRNIGVTACTKNEIRDCCA